MNRIADRAEHIAAHLIRYTLGAEARVFDRDKRQGAVDFRLGWPDGSAGALEVTMVADERAMEWQGLMDREVSWPAESTWEYRPHGYRVSYRQAKDAAVKLAGMCEATGIDDWRHLSASTRQEDALLWHLAQQLGGTLRRSRLFNEPGIHLQLPVQVEFVPEEPPALAEIIETWCNKPHVVAHVRKLIEDQCGSERHLFLVPMPEVLTATYLADDFPAPIRRPEGFEGIEGLWLWSNYWKRFLGLRDGSWSWYEFPHP